MKKVGIFLTVTILILTMVFTVIDGLALLRCTAERLPFDGFISFFVAGGIMLAGLYLIFKLSGRYGSGGGVDFGGGCS